ncbi:MAG: SprT-like domain-containing protein [Gemmatimonadales bacterium]
MPPEDLLRHRLSALGLTGVERVVTHTNRTVMLSLNEGVLRIHRGYTLAPDRVLKAIVRFLKPRTRRATRRAMEQVFLTFPVEMYAPPERPRRPERVRVGDRETLDRLSRLHETLNTQYFDGRLRKLPIWLSDRMRTRLGELTVDLKSGKPVEITLSRRHLRSHGWAEVARTLLHEMIHQWQAESGMPVDHGREFRRKAKEVGVEPRARREVVRVRSEK